MVKPLDQLDIVVTIFNQEEIIERVLYGIFKNTTTPFNLVLVFDGCTDKTKPRALAYLKRVKSTLLRNLIIKDTRNLFELRANNFAFKLATTDYLITVQDDMVIREFGWERRLTYPLRRFDDVLGVTGRDAHDIKSIGPNKEEYINGASRGWNNLNHDIFAVRDVINRGPIAFRVDYLKALNYLNDRYAPCAHDDAEISLRAWKEKGWKVGSFWIDYLSKKEWSKVNAADSTMKAWDSCLLNQARIRDDFKDYLENGIKHDEEYSLGREVDYIKKNVFLNNLAWMLVYPLRLDKRRMKSWWATFKRKTMEVIKTPFVKLLGVCFGPQLLKRATEQGFKKALVALIRKNG